MAKGWHNERVRHKLAAKGIGLRKIVEKFGTLYDSGYPTDNYGGFNTGEGKIYQYKGNYYEITFERNGIRSTFRKLPPTPDGKFDFEDKSVFYNVFVDKLEKELELKDCKRCNEEMAHTWEDCDSMIGDRVLSTHRIFTCTRCGSEIDDEEYHTSRRSLW